MDDQKIIDSAPEGAAEVCFIRGEAIYNIYPFKPIRSLADIKELVELRKDNAKLELTCKGRANSINEMSNMISELQKANAELEANQARAETLIFQLYEQVYDNPCLDKQVELYEALKADK